MDPSTSGLRWPSRRRCVTAAHTLSHDVLCMIFSLLDLLQVVRCTAVCKSWKAAIDKHKLLELVYCKQQRWSAAGLSDASTSSETSLKKHLEEQAMDRHNFSLRRRLVKIYQWKGHSVRVDQCRMKMGLILTGVGDKVMRLWSAERYKCLDEYSLPDKATLVDLDFDESKVVGLLGTQICIWRRNGDRNIFPSREGLFTKGLCMRYADPEAVVGCVDGTARIFDMYSRKCSQIIKMHAGPVTCLSVSDDQLIISGSSIGSITLSGLSMDRQIAKLGSTDSAGIRTLCFNPYSNLLFAGSTAGYASCWDLRMMRNLWKNRVSPNVIYSMHHLPNDRSTLVVGGIDGVLRMVDQNSGEVLSRCIVCESNSESNSSKDMYGVLERKQARRLSEDTRIDLIPKTCRPPIRCLAVGMQKVVTTHNDKYIRLWKFG